MGVFFVLRSPVIKLIMGNCFQPTVSSTEMRVNYRTDRIRSYMTSSESSSGEEIIGTGQFLSDYVFMS